MLLIVDRSQKSAETICDIFNFFGILAYPVTYEQALREVSNRFDAIIIVSPEQSGNLEEFVKSLRVYSLGAPVYAITDKIGDVSYSEIFDKTYYRPTFNTSTVFDLALFKKQRSKRIIGNYKLAGIDACVFHDNITYFGKPIKLTKTESMIFRYLISAYPNPAKAADVLKFAFKSSKRPDVANVRTHISIINKKFSKAFGKSIIKLEPKQGYIIVPVAKSSFVEF